MGTSTNVIMSLTAVGISKFYFHKTWSIALVIGLATYAIVKTLEDTK